MGRFVIAVSTQAGRGAAADGTAVEVFERLSTAAIERAHRSPAVQALWAEFGAACDYVPIASAAEARRIFSEFEALAT